MTERNRKRQPKKKRSSRLLRRFRTLLLLAGIGLAVFYWQPLMQLLPGREQPAAPAAKAAMAPAASAVWPTDPAFVAVRRDTAYLLSGPVLRALKPDGTPLWEKTLPEPGTALYPSFDGVFVQVGDGTRLLRYSGMGKLNGTVIAPGPFTAVQESVNGILFEDRTSGRFTWTDVAGKVLGTQDLAEAHILKAVMDPDSGDTVIATLKNDGSTLESALHRFDAGGRLTGARTFRDAVLLQMGFMNTRLMVVLDNRLISLDPQMRDYWLVRDPARYQGAAFGQDRLWVDRIQTGVQEAQVVQCYNRDGQVVTSIPFTGGVSLMAAGPKDQLAVVSGQRVQIYTERGALGGELQLAQVPLGLTWLDDKRLLVRYGDSYSIETTEARKLF